MVIPKQFSRSPLLCITITRVRKLQPLTKPVEANRENAYFFLSSWQKLKPPPNECPISPLPLSKVV